MATSKLILLLFSFVLLASYTIDGGNDFEMEALEILVNGKPFDPEKNLISEHGIITLGIKNQNSSYEYKFEEIEVEVLLKRQVLGLINKEGYARSERIYGQQGARRLFRLKYKNCNLRIWQPNVYRKYSATGKISIPYNQFKTKCLSRVVIHIKKVKKRKGNLESNIEVYDLGIPKKLLSDGISFYPNWITCQDD